MGRDGGLFGRVALERGYVSQECLQRALRLQEEARAFGLQRPLGDVLVALGALTPARVQRILALQRRRPREAEPDEPLPPEPAPGPPRVRIFPRAEDPPLDPETACAAAQARDLLFAAVALRDGFLLVSELERALEEQIYRPEPVGLVEVLRGRGILSADQTGAVERALETSRDECVRLPGYAVVDLLGFGSTSIVLRARHELIEREVAIKVFREEHMARATLEGLLREAQAVAAIRHPNVVGLYELGQACRRFYYVMELCEGPTLLQRIAGEGWLPPGEALRCARDVARALGAIEAAGLVHRDVKPQNIVLTAEGAKLTDLGLARPAGRAARAQVEGTPHTMAPELIAGHALDIRADLYGLGATLFYALTGSPPFDGESDEAILAAHCGDPAPDPREWCPELAPDVARLTLRLLAKEPGARPPDPASLVEELEGLLRAES